MIASHEDVQLPEDFRLYAECSYHVNALDRAVLDASLLLLQLPSSRIYQTYVARVNTLLLMKRLQIIHIRLFYKFFFSYICILELLFSFIITFLTLLTGKVELYYNKKKNLFLICYFHITSKRTMS